MQTGAWQVRPYKSNNMNKADSPKPTIVSRPEVIRQLADEPWQRDEALTTDLLRIGSEPVDTRTAYTHPDGRVLIVFEFIGEGRLFQNLHDFNLWLMGIESRIQAARTKAFWHILENRLPQGKDFVQHVPQLIDQLAETSGIPREQLDNSYASLEKVERVAQGWGKARCLEVPIFPMLVAYIGEVMRHDVDGYWEMRLAYHHSDIWEPWIMDREGRECNPFSFLYDMLTEPGEEIYFAPDLEVRMRRKPPPYPPGPQP
jgi:hypothetical protein